MESEITVEDKWFGLESSVRLVGFERKQLVESSKNVRQRDGPSFALVEKQMSRVLQLRFAGIACHGW